MRSCVIVENGVSSIFAVRLNKRVELLYNALLCVSRHRDISETKRQGFIYKMMKTNPIYAVMTHCALNAKTSRARGLPNKPFSLSRSSLIPGFSPDTEAAVIFYVLKYIQ